MKPYSHQVEMSDKAYAILKEYMIVYLACEERTGKTLTALMVAEKAIVDKVLVITKKKALDGWHAHLEQFSHYKKYTVTNYHQACKIYQHYDLVILDESHNYISSYPKPGKLWKDVFRVTRQVPIIYISATPYAQGPQQLYHQFALSSWSPWKSYTNFYHWFKYYGKPYTIPINGINVQQYDKCHTDRILACVKHLFITTTRKELGFQHEPKDSLHYIKLDKETSNIYNQLIVDDIATISCCDIVCDSTPKLRTSLHQLEGGTIKVGDIRHELPNKEKINYILRMFGDSDSLVIMYNYIAEKDKLSKYFKKAKLLQATSFAEGIDLYEYKDLVIYSQDFSTARHTQRRARQCNKNREHPIHVHYLLVKKAISEQVYKTVSVNKRNFVDSVFSRSVI